MASRKIEAMLKGVDFDSLTEDETQELIAAIEDRKRQVKLDTYADLLRKAAKLHRELRLKGVAPGAKFLASLGDESR